MKNNLSRIAIIINIAPHYRSSLWLTLLQSNEFDFHFFYGASSFQGIKQIDLKNINFSPYSHRLHASLRNYWLNKKILVWQRRVIQISLQNEYDSYVFLGDMSCISTWIAAIILRLKGLQVVFWGHGLYGNEGRMKLFIRKMFYRLANKHILYERRAKKLMINKGFQENDLFVVFNSLDYDTHKEFRVEYAGLTKSDVYSFFKDCNLPTIVFIGRLTSSKKIDILISAINQINKNKILLNLIIIGDGEIQSDLELLGKRGIEGKWLYFRGACYDEEELARYLIISDLCVSPGNVGLNAIHCLGYGTPVCTHNNLSNQGPEVESIEEGLTGCFFKEDDENDLIQKLNNWLNNNPDRSIVRKNCTNIIDKYYNPNYQVQVINRLLYGHYPDI